MKVKHNKLRNIGLLFELLVHQITTDTLNNKDSKAVDILKKYFNNTEIYKEHKLYETLVRNTNISEQKANLLISSVLEARKKLNKGALKKQKYDLISEIKSNYNIEDFFKSKVENYKNLASIYIIFEMHDSSSIDAEKYSEYKLTILENMVKKEDKGVEDTIMEQYKNYDRGTKALIYKLAVKKFNEKYEDLNLDQKMLLKEYINNISTNNNLKKYINEQYTLVKREIKKYTRKSSDETRNVKMNEITNLIQPIPDNKQVTEKDVHNLLYYYELIKEIKNL
jgi:hypothetical protein